MSRGPTAAIYRVVHHSVIPELTVPSYRAEAARARTQGEQGREEYNEHAG